MLPWLSPLCLLLLCAMTPLSAAGGRHPQHKVATPPPPVIEPPPQSGAIVFSKRLYSSLASENATALAERFRPDFDSLNFGGALAETLDIIYDMRLQDLQTSVRHARKMRDVIDLLATP